MTDEPTRRTVLRRAASVASVGAMGFGGERFAATAGADGHSEAIETPTPTGTPTDGTGKGSANWPTFALDGANTGYAPDQQAPTEGVLAEWSFEIDQWMEASPVVADGTVYVGGNDFNVYALDAADGTERWRVDVDGLPSTPAVAGLPGDDGWHSPEDPTVYVGSSDGRLRALDAADGSERWSLAREDTFGTPATVEGGIVYAGNHDGNVYAVTADEGERRWSYDTGGIVQPAPAVVDDTVYVGSNAGVVAALDAADGSEAWTVETDGSVLSAPTVGDGTVYVGSDDDRLRALATGDGTERWVAGFDSGIRGSPVVGDGTVYAATTDGRVSALDAGDGSEQWRATVGPVVASPVVVGNRLYVGTLAGRIHALRLDGGSEAWSVATGADVATTPACADGRLYVGSRDGSLYALVPDPEATPTPTGTPRTTADSTTTGTATPRNGSGTSTRTDAGSDPTARQTRSPAQTASSGAASERPKTTTGGGSGTTFRDLPALVGGLALGALGVGTLGGGYLWARSRDGDQDEPGDRSGATGDSHGSVGPSGGDSTGNDPPASGPTSSDPGGDGSASARSADDLEPSTGGFIDGAAEVSLTLGNEAGSEADPSSGDGVSEAPSEGDPHGPGPRTAADSGEWGDPDWPVPGRVPGAPDLAVGYDDIERGELLGRGGQADVYRASVAGTARSFALKELRGGAGGPPLAREAETWAALADHDHVVDVVAWGDDPAPWLLVEYMDGGHLGRRAGTMAFDQAVWTAVAVARAVRHAHRQGVVHFDLKPSNVLFRTVEGAWDVPKVADWGLSRRLLTHSGTVEGFSPKYAAPEQIADGFGDPNDRTDVYQLGALCYALFTGRPPYRGDPAAVARAVVEERPPPPSDVADLPRAVDDVLDTAMARDPRDRHESVLYLRDDLMALVDES